MPVSGVFSTLLASVQEEPELWGQLIVMLDITTLTTLSCLIGSSSSVIGTTHIPKATKRLNVPSHAQHV